MTKIKELSRVEKLKLELKEALRIEKANKKFDALSPKEKRISIAKDVILSVNAGRFYMKTGSYFNAQTTKTTKDLQEVLCDTEGSCQVCAMGGVFASKVRLGNSFTTEGEKHIGVDDDTILNTLKGIFSEKQLRTIEGAFERGIVWDSPFSLSEQDRIEEKCICFYDKYDSADDRMIGIMENLIQNNGTFKP